MIFMIEENRVGELVQGNHRNQINPGSDNQSSDKQSK